MKKILIVFTGFLVVSNFNLDSAAPGDSIVTIKENNEATKKLHTILSNFSLGRNSIDLIEIENLLENGANINELIKSKHIGFIDGLKNYDLLKLFLQWGGNPNIFDLYGKTPLTYLSKDDSNKRLIELLLENGADPNLPSQIPFWNPSLHIEPESYRDFPASTPLMIASAYGQKEIVKLLLNPKYKTDVNIKTIQFDNYSALSFALQYHKPPEQDNSEIIKMLLESGANMDCKIALTFSKSIDCLQRINENPNLKKIYDDFQTYKKKLKEQTQKNLIDLASFPKEIAKICTEYL